MVTGAFLIRRTATRGNVQEGHSAFFCSKLGTTFRLHMVNLRERVIARQKEGFERVCDYVCGGWAYIFFSTHFYNVYKCVYVFSGCAHLAR